MEKEAQEERSQLKNKKPSLECQQCAVQKKKTNKQTNKKKTLQNRRKRKLQCSLPRLQSWVRDGVIKRLQVTLSLNLNLILIISSFATSIEYVLKETTSWALSQCFRTKLNYKKNGELSSIYQSQKQGSPVTPF